MDLEAYRDCQLCPRLCRVDRVAGQVGVCGETAVCRVASFVPHHGEEPAFTGERGSGTIFFSGCACRCVFCQNWQISHEHLGEPVDLEALTAAALALVGRGVHNLNFVTPDHVWPHVRALCRRLRAAGVTLPFIMNGSGYARAEMVPEYAEHIDIFLPDFKFADAALAQRCMGAADYPERALSALQAMVTAAGFLRPWDDAGRVLAEKGVLTRHLVLPGQIENSLEVLRLLHRHFGPRLPVSIMSQYRPMPRAGADGFLDGVVSADEYARVCDLAEALGFERAFIQPDFGDSGYTPDFREEEPFTGNQRGKEC